MNRPVFYILIGIFAVTVLAGIVLFILPTPAEAPKTTQAGIPDLISVSTPRNGAVASSPLSIEGSARGYWYFEASFPIELRDASGAIIAKHYAQAQGEWMTEEFVPFIAALSFPPQPKGSQGTLILRKDNPSGLPENDRSIEIQIVF